MKGEDLIGAIDHIPMHPVCKIGFKNRDMAVQKDGIAIGLVGNYIESDIPTMLF